MNIIKRVKEMIAGQSRKKLMENTVIVIIIGVIIIVAGGTFLGGGKSDGKKEQKKAASAADGAQATASILNDAEERLGALLSQMQGVGKADVMITYSTTRENVPAYDIKKNEGSTDEKDNQGGARKVNQEEFESVLVYEDSSAGGKKPVTPSMYRDWETDRKSVV